MSGGSVPHTFSGMLIDINEKKLVLKDVYQQVNSGSKLKKQPYSNIKIICYLHK